MGPFLAIDFHTAPNNQGYQKGSLILETLHVKALDSEFVGLGSFRP